MARTKSSPSDTSAHLGFEALVPVRKDLAADTATRVSANPDCAAIWRDLRGAQDHRSNTASIAAF